MSLQVTTLSQKGQVVIPLEVREKLHLEAGSKFIVYPLEDAVVLKRIEPPSFDEWDEALKPLRLEAKRKGISEKDVDEMVGQARRRK